MVWHAKVNVPLWGSACSSAGKRITGMIVIASAVIIVATSSNQHLCQMLTSFHGTLPTRDGHLLHNGGSKFYGDGLCRRCHRDCLKSPWPTPPLATVAVNNPSHAKGDPNSTLEVTADGPNVQSTRVT
eukprot:855644-Amphidinium_carterae.1